MSEERRLQNLLSALEERMKNEEISRRNYERLKNKYENKLTEFKNLISIICANCGETLRVDKGKKRFTCPSCGFTNKIIRKESTKGPEKKTIDDLASVEERMRDYKRFRNQVGPEAMEILKRDLSEVRFKISSTNLHSSKMLMEKALSIEGHLEVLELYYKDHKRFEELGVRPDGSLKVIFKAAVPSRSKRNQILDLLKQKAEIIAIGEAARLELEDIGKQQISWELSEKETGYYFRDVGLDEIPRSRNPFVASLEVLEQRNKQGAKVSGTEEKLLEIYRWGWKSRDIDAFRIPEADIGIFPKREHLVSLEEKKKGLIRKKVKQAAVDVWKIARVWVPHWRLTYTSALGKHTTLLGSLASQRIDPPITLCSLKKEEYLAPTVEGNAEEWLKSQRVKLITLARRLTKYERKFRLRTKKEEYAEYAWPVVRSFRNLGLEVEYKEAFLKVGLKVDGKWLKKGEYEKIASSIELMSLDYVYLPANFGMFQSKTTYCGWFYLQSLLNGIIAILSAKHPIVDVVARGRGY